MSRRSKGAASVAGRASALSQSAMMFDQPNTPTTKKEEKKPPALSQQDLLATLDTNSSSSLSKLEQARQRALQRSQHNTSHSQEGHGAGDSNIGNNNHNSFQTPSHGHTGMTGFDESPPPPPPPPSDSPAFQPGKQQSRRLNPRAGGSSVKDRMSKLDMMTKVRNLR